MNTDRIVIKKKLNEFPNAGTFFQKISGIDVNHIPEQYGDDVTDAQNMLKEHAEIVIIYKVCEIEAIEENEVILEDGKKLSGQMPPMILKDSKQLVSCVISLQGFTEASEQSDDIMIEYFMDSWGSAYVECAQAWLGKHVKEELAKEGLKRTHLWSPGQHRFELTNQRTLFDILRPEEEGCTLTESYMMVPVKSGSGIWGVIDESIENVLLPCDFCALGATCPSSKRGCAEL